MKKKKKLRPLPKVFLRVGIVQMTSGEDIEANVEFALKSLEKLAGEGCDIVCFPENSLFLRVERTGTAISFMDLREKFWAKFSQVAGATNCHLFFGSVPYKKGRRTSNATVYVGPGRKPKVVYEKIHLFDVDVEGAAPVRESADFKHGNRIKFLDIKGWRIGLSICYDLRFSELYSRYARANAHVILVPSAFLVPTGEAHWHVLLRARAIESQAFVVAAAQAGTHSNGHGGMRSTFGHSLVVDPWGRIVWEGSSSQSEVHAVTLSPEILNNVRLQIPMEHHRRL